MIVLYEIINICLIWNNYIELYFYLERGKNKRDENFKCYFIENIDDIFCCSVLFNIIIKEWISWLLNILFYV